MKGGVAPLMLGVVLALLFSSRSDAQYSTMSTGTLTKSEKTQFLGEFQYITSEQQLNLLARFEHGINQDFDYQLVGGVGASFLAAGAFMKWVPIPDYRNQPAVGGLFGVFLARSQSERDFSLRLHPFVSKRIDSKIGEFEPFASLPVAYAIRGDEDGFPVHLALGTGYQHSEMKDYRVFAEMGIALNYGHPYLSLGIEYQMEHFGGGSGPLF